MTRLGAERVLPAYDVGSGRRRDRGDLRRPADRNRRSPTAKAGQNKKSRVVFDGFLTAITLPRSLTGTTVVLTDRGLWENFKTKWRGGALGAGPARAREVRAAVRGLQHRSGRGTRAVHTGIHGALHGARGNPPGSRCRGGWPKATARRRAAQTNGSRRPVRTAAYWKPAGGKELVRLAERHSQRYSRWPIPSSIWTSGRPAAARRSTNAPAGLRKLGCDTSGAARSSSPQRSPCRLVLPASRLRRTLPGRSRSRPSRSPENLYYVGDKGLADPVIAHTSQGHVLINSNLEESVPPDSGQR